MIFEVWFVIIAECFIAPVLFHMIIASMQRLARIDRPCPNNCSWHQKEPTR